MKIAVDGGALVKEKKYGTAIFSENLLKSLLKNDKKNFYYIYGLAPEPNWLINYPNKLYFFSRISLFWSTLQLSLLNFFNQPNYFLALNQAIPPFFGAKVISFSHGLSFKFFPKFYQQEFARLNQQLNLMINQATLIIVSSIKVKKEFENFFPGLNKIKTIPFGIPLDMLETGLRKKKKFFLFVGLNQPIKNVAFLVTIFKKMKKKRLFQGYKLVLVGDFEHLENKSSSIIVYKKISRHKLKQLYLEATAYLTASFYESFNLPVLEALSQRCPVIGLKSAIIPELAPFVNLAENTNQFEQLLNLAAAKKLPTNIPVALIKKTFSWDNYVKILLNYLK
ncbi:MAG: glycosyltransferase [Microgenomates group bacterium]|nr:glycosyltransferase [Microgenomates group bacterium]